VALNCDCSDTTGYRTLLELRQDMLRRLGYGAQVANPPPGMADLLTSFLQDAQRSLIRRFPSLRTERWFSWSLTAGERFYDLPDNDEAATLATPVNAAFSTATTGGTVAAGAHAYRVSALNANGETLASTETSITTTGATSTVTVNWSAVTGATGYKVYGRTTGAELRIATVGAVTTYIDTGAVTPAGALPSANTTATCAKTFDPLRITWVGVTHGTVRYPLMRGIPPEVLDRTTTNSYPSHYDIRQCIEIWPAPAATEGTLRIRAHFQAEAFAADADKPTIDDQAVFLLALANAKAHYGKPDANNIVSQLEVYLQGLVAGTHGPQRYIPGEGRSASAYVEPKTTVPFT
jgi:hypothetical protein